MSKNYISGNKLQRKSETTLNYISHNSLLHFRMYGLSKGLVHGWTSFRSDILTRKHGEDSYETIYWKKRQTILNCWTYITRSRSRRYSALIRCDNNVQMKEIFVKF